MPAAIEPVVVTGSSGFIGQHFFRAAGRSGRPLLGIDRAPCPDDCPGEFTTLDLAGDGMLERVTSEWHHGAVVHLAADAEVIMPWLSIPRMFASNLTATWNVLHILRPRLCIFASSSSVYGTATRTQTDPRTAAINPLGLYAHSKAMAETLLREWSTQTGSPAVIFRFGNVIGTRCRGLIPLLVEHAVRHPDAERPVELRGDGLLVRDYTPVRFVTDVMRAALNSEPLSGAVQIFNIGTGRGMTNRQVTEIVTAVLEREGYRLRATYGNPVPKGEARSVILDCEGVCEHFDLNVPDEAEVVRTIEEAALFHLAARSARV